MSSLPLDMLVLCGGQGSRLAMTQLTPKPLLPIGGSPFLLRLLTQWHREGVQRFVLSVCHLAEQFYEFAKKYTTRLGSIEVVHEKDPLGTGGGLKFASSAMKSSSFFVANGDSYVSEPLNNLLQFHQKNSSGFSLLAIPAQQVIGSAKQKGNLRVGADHALTNFKTQDESADGLVNAGVYLIERSHIESWPSGKYDLERNIFENSQKYPVKVLKSSAKLMDIGRPDCYPLFDQKLGKVDLLFSELEKL
jgi:D-glycero-alpha-D-manno-heptose 1-phosphate guanylyltransferase